MCGKAEHQAIVCKSRMMTNTERERQMSSLYVCPCTYSCNCWENLTILSLDIYGKWGHFWAVFPSLGGCLREVVTWVYHKSQNQTWDLNLSYRKPHKIPTLDLNWTLTFLSQGSVFPSSCHFIVLWVIAKAVISLNGTLWGRFGAKRIHQETKCQVTKVNSWLNDKG